ncbi:MAG: hypothetical protein PHN56_04780 [Candidatus Nanoarchaeia archaeon]|nr:hypothetical protein [Candidatus Nanoarchaeia archaeon]
MITKWQQKMKGFKEIYENSEKIKLKEELSNIEDKIYPFVKEDIIKPLMHVIIHIIETQNISYKNLETCTYSFYYYFIKDYLFLDKFVKMTGMNIKQLEEEGKKTFEIFKESYKKIEKIEFDEIKFKEDIKKLVKISHEKNKI